MANSVDRGQTAVCSGSTLFASILNLSIMLGNYLQQTTSVDDIFRCIFFLGALRLPMKRCDKNVHTKTMYTFKKSKCILSKKSGKDHESIQSSTTPDPGYQMGK